MKTRFFILLIFSILLINCSDKDNEILDPKEVILGTWVYTNTTSAVESENNRLNQAIRESIAHTSGQSYLKKYTFHDNDIVECSFTINGRRTEYRASYFIDEDQITIRYIDSETEHLKQDVYRFLIDREHLELSTDETKRYQDLYKYDTTFGDIAISKVIAIEKYSHRQ